MDVDVTLWSGDGTFTQVLMDTLKTIEEIASLRVEDAPASRAESGYNFISNELYVTFKDRRRVEAIRRFGIVPGTRVVTEKALTIESLASRLEQLEDVGAADYGDSGMIQYLKTERIVPPFQTRGLKVVELIRIYEAGTEPRR